MFLKRLKISAVLKEIRFCGRRNNHYWVLPEGWQTPIKVYNCVTRKKEPLIVQNKNVVTWYTCGPTVYDSSHIGHAACYVRLDIIQRILKRHFGLNIVTCMNITDIDDKIIKKSIETTTDYRMLTQKYESEFWEDLRLLGISRPDVVMRVTENIPLIINFIQKLEQNNVVYKAKDDSVYFDVMKGYQHYGKLQNMGESAPDKSNSNKKSPLDFAVWKSKKESYEPAFPSPWGLGRPGWHIECSALASSVFGAHIDVHAGGIDLRFPHHENEEAQSCAFHNNHQWVNYWIHTGHLHLKDSTKMSKSLKNTISIKEMLTNMSSDTFRLLCAMSPYSKPIEYSEELIQTATSVLKMYKNFINMCGEVEKGYTRPYLDRIALTSIIKSTSEAIDKSLSDNFNTPLVIKYLNDGIAKINSLLDSSPSKNGSNICNNVHLLMAYKNLLFSSLDLIGIELKSGSRVEMDNSSEMIELLTKFRQNIRNIGLNTKNKDILSACDGVRDSLNKCGVTIKDRGKVSTWYR